MLCALSGQPASDPVVSPRSGAVFHRPLIVAYIASTGKDPLNDQPLAELELVTLSAEPAVAVPKPAAYNSIPTMLAAFQNEWDALALETFTLRKQLHSAREELSTALYQYDAAARVAAKAIRERDEAREALVKLSAVFAEADEADSGETDANGENEEGEKNQLGDGGIPVAVLSAARDSLFALHKNQKIALPVSASTKINFALKSTPLQVDNPTLLAVNDTWVAASTSHYQLGTGAPQELANITAATFLHNQATQSTPLVIATDKLVTSETETSLPLSVTHVAPHPTEPILAVLTLDNRWALTSDKSVYYQSAPLESPSAIALHVDGILVAVGTAGEVRVFDATSTEQVSVLPTKHAHVDKIQFGLNGYWLAVGSSSATESAVQIFDLRKNSLVHELNFMVHSLFVLDPSCLVLTTYADTLQAHLYVKKGKKWVDNVAELEVEPLRRLELQSTAEEVSTSKTVEIVGLGESQLYHYTMSLA